MPKKLPIGGLNTFTRLPVAYGFIRSVRLRESSSLNIVAVNGDSTPGMTSPPLVVVHTSYRGLASVSHSVRNAPMPRIVARPTEGFVRPEGHMPGTGHETLR